MLNIIHREGLYSFKTDNLDYNAGMVATFIGNRQVGICNDKTIPVGFFVHDSCRESIVFDATIEKASTGVIAVGHGEFQTDIFEKSEYKHNDFLYCSCNGKITNETKYRGNFVLGIVNSVTEKEIGFITCFTRYVELRAPCE